MSIFGDLISTLFEKRYRNIFLTNSHDKSIIELSKDLLGSFGEVSAGALAHMIFDKYSQITFDEKRTFFNFMAHDLEINPDEVRVALDAYQTNPSETTYKNFSTASEPKRQELIRRLNHPDGATERLVGMRKDLLSLIKENPELAPLGIDLKHLFTSWFNRGFLVLRPINWSSPAEILEKIIAYEAVHAINSWEDLRARLQPEDRRCFAFFHPAMPDEPLIFVEVALTKGIPNSIQGLLEANRDPISPDDSDTAVFYSISNCQQGLAGISFGNSLIKQVVADLSLAVPSLSTFVTLSPIPKLKSWLKKDHISVKSNHTDQAIAAYYLLNAKDTEGRPYDPVARFHLGNGAMLHAVHADADKSENGIDQSNGVMVNYRYDLKKIPQNHERFLSENKIAVSTDVRALAGSIK
ncbi:MAG: malonyl-CoA decarboxylase [Planktomarina sp.]|nr:malonyl-CoA decarboxylase [Planktomarina sp.]MDT2017619.1 malonyl-CoA decarboxylase [Planktomarina sp.]